MIGYDVEHVVPATRTECNESKQPLRCVVQHCAQLTFDLREPRAEGRRRILVLVVPLLPVRSFHVAMLRRRLR
jgi:hypothetical protein